MYRVLRIINVSDDGLINTLSLRIICWYLQCIRIYTKLHLMRNHFLIGSLNFIEFRHLKFHSSRHQRNDKRLRWKWTGNFSSYLVSLSAYGCLVLCLFSMLFLIYSSLHAIPLQMESFPLQTYFSLHFLYMFRSAYNLAVLHLQISFSWTNPRKRETENKHARERERERNHYNNKPSRAIITQYIICLRRKVCSELERRGWKKKH